MKYWGSIPTKTKKTLKRILLWLGAFILVFFVCAFLSLSRFTFVRAPLQYPNTLWECQEYDLYFVVDKMSYCLGEIITDEKHFYVDYCWNTLPDFIAQLVRVEASEDGIPEMTPRRFNYGIEYVRAPCKYRHKKAIIYAEPEDFWLWDIDEPIKLTFVCKGKVSEVDFHSGVDPIRRMEVID